MRPLVRFRQPLLELLPVLAAVHGLVDRRLRPAVDQREDVPAPLVARRVHRVGIARVDPHLVDARVLGDVEDALPALAAVGRLVEAAVAAVGPERTLRGHEDLARVARVDDDPADVLRILQADVLPRLPAVVGPVDAVAVRHRALAVVLAAPDPDDERVLRIDREAADRVGALLVEDRLEARAVVRRLPDAPGRRRDVEGVAPRRGRRSPRRAPT